MNPPWLDIFAWRWTELPAAMAMLPSAWGWGKAALRITTGTSNTVKGLPVLMTGFSFVMLFSLFLGVTGLMSATTGWIILLTGIILALANGGMCLLRQWHGRIDPGIVVISILLLTLFSSAWILPIGWDELTYHLELPWRWHCHGFAAIYDDLPYSGFPSGPELLFWNLLETGGWRSPRLLCWLLNMVFFLAVYERLRRYSGGWTATTLTVALITTPVFLMLQREAFVEIFILLNAMALLELSETDSSTPGWWLMTGCGVGSCIAIKLYGLAVAAAALMPTLWIERQQWRRLTAIAATALLLATPFYLRPWLTTGNPLHPFYAAWFGGGLTDRLVSDWHHAAAAAKFGLAGWNGWFTAPVSLAWAGSSFDGTLGLQWLPLLFFGLVAAVVGWRLRKTALRLRIISVVAYYLCWYGLMPQVRFLLPALILALPVMTDGLSRLYRYRRSTAAASGLLLLLAIWSAPVPAVRHYLNCWRYLAGNISTADLIYSATGPGYLPAAEMARRLVPADEKILLLFDHRLLYFPPRTELATPFFQRKYFTPLPESAEKTWLECREKRVRYLMILLTPHNPDRPAKHFQSSLIMVNWLDELCREKRAELLWSGEGGSLYRLQSI